MEKSVSTLQSTQSTQSALYLGSGLDVSPLLHLQNIKNFIFIDSLPRTSNPSTFSTNEIKNENNNWFPKLIDIMQKIGFNITEEKELENYIKTKFTMTQSLYYKIHKSKIPRYINPTMLKFLNKKTGQTVKYYISTEYPVNFSSLINDEIKSCDSLIISDFDPDSSLIKNFSGPINIYAYPSTQTCKYNKTKEELDGSESSSLNYYFSSLNSSESSKFIKSINKINKTTGQIILCNKWSDLD